MGATVSHLQPRYPHSSYISAQRQANPVRFLRDFCNPDESMGDSRTGQLHFRLPFCLRSACRAQNTPALRTHALLPDIRSAPFRCGLLPRDKLGSPSTNLFHSPWEGVAPAHPPGKHVPHPADKPQKTELNTMFNKVILIGRLGKNAEVKTAQNNKDFVVLSVATSESWKNDKGEYDTRTEWHRVYAWGNLTHFAKTLQTGQLVSLEGKVKYRPVVEEVEGKPFRHTIAEIHASSLKRLSKVEAADDPTDGAEEG
jgi:single-strand DNA-binding protein